MTLANRCHGKTSTKRLAALPVRVSIPQHLRLVLHCIGVRQAASASLGDVRESARVFVNDRFVGCAWALPYVVDCGDAVVEGTNTLRVEVTNLPANRIRQMDIDGRQWRIFEDVNILDISKGNIGVSGITSYADWKKMPSGLNSEVRLIPMRKGALELKATHTHGTRNGGT